MFIEQKYLNIVSSQLSRFKKTNDFLWNFRCPYCGDSQKSTTKARGFVFRKEQNLIYKCISHFDKIFLKLSIFIIGMNRIIHFAYVI